MTHTFQTSMSKLLVFVFRGGGYYFWPGGEVQSKSWRKGGAGNIHLLKYFAMELEEGEDWGALGNYCDGYCRLLFVVFGEAAGILWQQVFGWFGIQCWCDRWGLNMLGGGSCW